MTSTEQRTRPDAPCARHFLTTQWSVVLDAAAAENPSAQEALNRLCSTYWYPLYAWLRGRGHGQHDAKDLTQGFFVHLLDKDRLRTVSPHKGKFRSFLLAALKNFLTNEHDKAQALKRGSQFTIISVDAELGESRYRLMPSHQNSPDKALDQSWAVIVLETVLSQLRGEYTREQKAPLFEALQCYLAGERGGTPYAEAAARLGLSESALKMAVLRLRRRFGEMLRQEVARTVTSEQEIDEEIRALFAAVRG